MLSILVAIAILAAPDKEPPAKGPKEEFPVVHRLRCQEGQRLFDALVAAKAPVKVTIRPETCGDTRIVSLPKLDCVWHNGGAYDPGIKDFVECEAPKAKGEAAMRIHEALLAARIPMDIGMMKAVSTLKDVVCKSTQAGTECTFTNELASGPKGQDVRQDNYQPKCEKR
ncbi:MAG: hypothetical protein QM765_25265 [Myxococcales bacterium]